MHRNRCSSRAGGHSMIPAIRRNAIAAGDILAGIRTGAVGLRGANRFDDVHFVQWCLYKASKWDGLDRVAKVTAADYKRDVNSNRHSQNECQRSCTGLKTDNLVEKITFLSVADLGGYGWPSRPDAEFSAVHDLYWQQRRLFDHEAESNSQRGPPTRISAARPHAGVRVAHLRQSEACFLELNGAYVRINSACMCGRCQAKGEAWFGVRSIGRGC